MCFWQISPVIEMDVCLESSVFLTTDFVLSKWMVPLMPNKLQTLLCWQPQSSILRASRISVEIPGRSCRLVNATSRSFLREAFREHPLLNSSLVRSLYRIIHLDNAFWQPFSKAFARTYIYSGRFLLEPSIDEDRFRTMLFQRTGAWENSVHYILHLRILSWAMHLVGNC